MSLFNDIGKQSARQIEEAAALFPNGYSAAEHKIIDSQTNGLNQSFNSNQLQWVIILTTGLLLINVVVEILNSVMFILIELLNLLRIVSSSIYSVTPP